MSSAEVLLGRRPLARAEYDAVVHGGARVSFDGRKLARHREQLEQRLAEGAVVYGVNTGFGAEATRAIPRARVVEVQHNTIRASAQGNGPPLHPRIVRGAMLLKAQSYAQGPPAVRPALVEALVAMINSGATPSIPDIPSPSCADLVQQAHIGLALIGEAPVWLDGELVPLESAGLRPLALAAKEGGSLVNDASLTIALALEAEREAGALVASAERTAAMTLEALGGHTAAFDELLVGCRPHRGALDAAAHLRRLLEGTQLAERCARPQDPYCLRCLPQVHGAVRDAVTVLRSVLDVEVGGIGDNPIVLEDGTVMSGGNFHAEAVAIPVDAVSLSMVEVAALSQARIQQLVHPLPDGDLPPKLAVKPNAGLGLTMLDTLALATLAEARVRATPATLGSGRVDEMEDHLPMTAIGVRSLRIVTGLAAQVVAIELACAAQALDFAGTQRASPAARDLHAAVREHVPFAAYDQPLDLAKLSTLVVR
ncbi:MAG TPA: aromatic amino acid ammonia-lyase [Thermoleophilaceae bacterium]|nr:aromatic amino acid ammonia-lyase [Thermoleophilaceae bacterium]